MQTRHAAAVVVLLLLAVLMSMTAPTSSLGAQPKPPVRGLVSMGAYKFVGSGGEPVNTLAPLEAKPGIFGGIVIVASWAQLQPTSGAALVEGNTIDTALTAVRAYDAKHPDKPLAVRLRVWGGFMAPAWVDALGGPPIKATHKNKRRHLGRFWTPQYRAAWRHLQELLAAKYDTRPLVREVAMTSCMSFTAEPFFLPSEDEVQKPIRAAGFTDAAFKTCLRESLDDYATWKRTRVVLSVNPLRTQAGQGPGDAEFTKGVMRECRRRLGVRCVLDNHDLDTQKDLARPLVPLYAFMKQLGPEIVFQTAQETPKDFEAVIRYGVSQGATAIELWQDYGGFPKVDDQTLKRWAKMIEDNKR